MSTDRETQLLADARAAGITSRKELANFMAQVGHESNGLTRLEESFRYTRGNAQIPVTSAWREGEAALTAARLGALQGKPERLAELMYGGRNGNDEPGDGYTYRGRGYIQLTGKDNYHDAGTALGLDLVNHPDLAAEPQNASKIAVWYWNSKVPEAAREDVKAATKAINGQYNGLEDRTARFEKWEKTLTPETMEHLSNGQIGTAATAGTPLRAPHAGTPKLSGHSDQPDNIQPSESVRKLQQDLVALGYGEARGQGLKVDGKLGPGTKQAIEAFQREHELNVDGIAGPRTLKAIEREGAGVEQTRCEAHLDNKGSPDHALYLQALAGVHRLDASLGRAPDQHSANVAAALTVAAKAEGLSRIDTVMLSADGSRVFAAQEGSPLRQIAEVPTAQAVNTSIAQSSAAAQTIQPAQAQAQTPSSSDPDLAQPSQQPVLQQQLKT